MDEIVDILRDRIVELGALSDERREAGATAEELEAYRLDIVTLQWELARLLISPSLPRVPRAA
jgi:hypothetical protein